MAEPRAFDSPTVRIERRGVAAVLVIHRPERRNALDSRTLKDIARAARVVAREPSARGIVVTGAGEHFAAGGDLREFGPKKSAAQGRRLATLGREAIDALLASGLPVIAAVNGDAHGGGCEIAAGCDLRVVESHARFHWAQGRFAVTTGWGATARLVALIGAPRATRWLLGMRAVPAGEAQESGFADVVVERGQAVDRASALVEELSAVSRATAKRMLGLIRGCVGQSFDEARAAELRVFGAAWASREHATAVQQFLQRPRGG